MDLYEILVPCERPDSTPDRPKYFTTKYHRIWDDKVRNITGGLTIIKPIVGEWYSKDGKLFRERNIPVRIACSREQIEEIADITAKYYGQQAIMFYRISDLVIIKNYNLPKFNPDIGMGNI